MERDLFEESILDYIEEKLDLKKRADFELALKQNPELSQLFSDYMRLTTAEAAVAEDKLRASSPFKYRVMERINLERTPLWSRIFQSLLAPQRQALVGACAVVLITFLLWPSRPVHISVSTEPAAIRPTVMTIPSVAELSSAFDSSGSSEDTRTNLQRLLTPSIPVFPVGMGRPLDLVVEACPFLGNSSELLARVTITATGSSKEAVLQTTVAKGVRLSLMFDPAVVTSIIQEGVSNASIISPARDWIPWAATDLMMLHQQFSALLKVTLNRAVKISQPVFRAQLTFTDPTSGREVEREERLFPVNADSPVSTACSQILKAIEP